MQILDAEEEQSLVHARSEAYGGITTDTDTERGAIVYEELSVEESGKAGEKCCSIERTPKMKVAGAVTAGVVGLMLLVVSNCTELLPAVTKQSPH